ncbi:DNA-binding protein [Winogradskyella undariae]|uniref:PPC domain-containing DNA-binding protein n=1 Tax=Winogradskyella TaxID=286104 RepID=UPI00156ACD1A|nr:MULTISPECIES: PPC domain-containing DNA-binding protein [Winogradskyella]NRR92570.1 DNA-binding protein [Winogradskyella undariae]QNK77993.1 DNA-binding protein [Winogradskyella sp. PAMC22761]QXP79002.1 DNA-binding protein [Winogradskyella sp. HaHa_3_26]
MKKSIFVILCIAVSFLANAQLNSELYTYKQIGNKYVISIQNHAEITKAITEFVKEHDIKAGTIVGLGAVNEATLRFFDPATKEFVDKTFSEQMEITNLTGNISQQNDKHYIHMHVTLGRNDYTALAGHLLTAKINGAAEFVIESFDGTVNRYHDEDTGLNLYDF